MDVLRTPDARFAGLADFPFAPHYATARAEDGTDLRVHFLDEGPRDAAPVLLLHGEPTWSYLYRHILPPLVAAGHRVLAPDLIGFGRSDKPRAQDDYTYERQVDWMRQWLLGQDWGGLIGLRLVAAMPDRFASVIAATTALPEGRTLSDALDRWLHYSQTAPAFQPERIIHRGAEREFQRRVPGARGQAHVTITGAGHFLQEDKPQEIAALISRFICGA